MKYRPILPTELWLCIIEILVFFQDPIAIRNLAFTCKTLYCITASFLFESITIVNACGYYPQVMSTLLNALKFRQLSGSTLPFPGYFVRSLNIHQRFATNCSGMSIIAILDIIRVPNSANELKRLKCFGTSQRILCMLLETCPKLKRVDIDQWTHSIVHQVNSLKLHTLKLSLQIGSLINPTPLALLNKSLSFLEVKCSVGSQTMITVGKLPNLQHLRMEGIAPENWNQSSELLFPKLKTLEIGRIQIKNGKLLGTLSLPLLETLVLVAIHSLPNQEISNTVKNYTKLKSILISNINVRDFKKWIVASLEQVFLDRVSSSMIECLYGASIKSLELSNVELSTEVLISLFYYCKFERVSLIGMKGRIDFKEVIRFIPSTACASTLIELNIISKCGCVCYQECMRFLTDTRMVRFETLVINGQAIQA